jgi:hypothetical protein
MTTQEVPIGGFQISLEWVGSTGLSILHSSVRQKWYLLVKYSGQGAVLNDKAMTSDRISVSC